MKTTRQEIPGHLVAKVVSTIEHLETGILRESFRTCDRTDIILR